MIAGKDPDFLRLLKHVKPDCDKPAFVIVSIRFLLLIKRGAERGGERGYRSLDVAGESVISRSRKIIFDKLRYSRFESFIDRVWGGKKKVPSCSKITLSYFGFFILRNNDERREDVDRSDFVNKCLLRKSRVFWLFYF